MSTKNDPEEALCYEDLEIKLETALAALGEIDRYNGLHNDLDAYLNFLAAWGMGKLNEKPNRQDFGLEGAAGWAI